MAPLLEWLQAALAAFGLLALPDSATYYGYVEGNYLYLSPISAGTVVEIAVEEGMEIAAGDLVFRLDDKSARAALAAARARLAEAEAVARDKATGGRPEEIAAVEAQLDEAQSKLQLARRTFARSEELVDLGVVTAARIDTDRANLGTAQAEVRRLNTMLETVQLPSRQGQVEAARRAVDAARALVDQSEIDLTDRAVHAPFAGLVDRIFLDAGEHAGAGAPVISLLPPGNLKIRFFVPEPMRPGFQLGDKVLVGCSACAEPVPARISYLSTQAEYTPPVIYSREERANLVFAIEARPESPFVLAPGQPVDVRPAP